MMLPRPSRRHVFALAKFPRFGAANDLIADHKNLEPLPENDVVRELLADSIKSPQAYKFLMSQLILVPRPASGIGFVASAVKDWGAVDESARLYEECVKLEPQSAAFCLNYVHTLEVLNEHDKAFQALKDFLKRNAKMNIGSLTCAQVFNAISGIDRLSDFKNWLAKTNLVDKDRCLLVDESKLPPLLPEDKMYDAETLDLLALLCTLVKLCYGVGALGVIPPIVALVEPIRQGRPFHQTTIRNEHAYYCCIMQLMETLKMPIENKQTVYVAGDSHCMTPAWRTIKTEQREYTLQPLLVTGMKCWHIREEGKFYPKVNFYRVVPSAPAGSKIVMMFGEIDCREGFLVSVQKCRYDSLEEAALVTINIYIDALLKLQQERHYQLFIHPVLPVIDVTRPIVTTYNRLLKKRALETPSLKWLDFFDELLTSEGKLKPQYELDGTHIHPNYLPLLERELQKHL